MGGLRDFLIIRQTWGEYKQKAWYAFCCGFLMEFC